MINFANGLSGRGIQVDLLAGTADGPFRSLVKPEVNVILLPGGMKRSIPFIRKYLKSDQPQILFSSQMHVNIAAILSKFLNNVQTKIVLREATTPSEYEKILPTTRQKIMMKISKLLFRFADHTIACGDDCREDCIRYYRLKPKNVSTVYSMFLNDEFYEAASEPVEHRWFDDGSRVIVSMARIMPVKDFPNLITAFAEVRKKVDTKLMIIGETDRLPDYFQGVLDLIDKLDVKEHIDFIGFKKNPMPYLSKCEIYVLSSKFEGMPGSLVQGMAMGCKLVSTNCRSGPREVLADGKRGELVPVGDSQALAEGILKSLEKNHDREQGRIWSEDFSEETSIKKLLGIFEQLN